MADTYLWKKGGRPVGPFPIEDVRKMIRSGTIGRFHDLSDDGGRTWRRASSFEEIWETTELVPVATAPPESGPVTVVSTPPHEQSVAPSETPGPKHPTFALALAGFISATAALVLSLGPLLIWAFRYEPGYWAVPLSLPLLAASITGLVLSGTAMARRRTAFATTGLVVGICGSVFGLVSAVGWLISPDPREDWIERVTATAVADLELARKNFSQSLKRYRDSEARDDDDQALQTLTKNLMVVTLANRRLLNVAASTPRFRQHFRSLESLKTAFISFQEAVRARNDLGAQEAIESIGQSSAVLKQLLDMLELVLTGQLPLEAAQAKFRDS